jgi:hypothetical protein
VYFREISFSPPLALFSTAFPYNIVYTAGVVPTLGRVFRHFSGGGGDGGARSLITDSFLWLVFFFFTRFVHVSPSFVLYHIFCGFRSKHFRQQKNNGYDIHLSGAV